MADTPETRRLTLIIMVLLVLGLLAGGAIFGGGSCPVMVDRWGGC